MSARPEMSGYDSAQRLREGDDLGRWRFAAEIAEVIRTTPADWSARIGIFGRWGEGKSTVLHFLEEILRPEGNIIFYFTPWAAQTLNELWQVFGIALLDAVKERGIKVEFPGKGAVRDIGKKLEPTPVPDALRLAAEFCGKGKLYMGGLQLLSTWLRPDGSQIKRVRSSLGERRVVVLVDDLDRATPELLPKLLLSLREILDLPGFTFVLAFDNDIVAEGIRTTNEAWTDGTDFLERFSTSTFTSRQFQRPGRGFC